MGLRPLPAESLAANNRRSRMTELLQTIETMISSETMTLPRSSERSRTATPRRSSSRGRSCASSAAISEITQRIDRGDTAENARELASLAKSIDGKQGALARLRAQLTELRHYADRVRIGRS